MASLPESSSSADSTCSRTSGRLDTWAVASTGLAVLASGSTAWMRSLVCGDSGGSDKPRRLIASAIRMPKPPEAATSVTRSPWGRRPGPSREAAWPTSSRLSTECTRSAPWRRKTASKTASEPGSAPVWEAAAAWPLSVAPIFSTITGLPASRAMASAANSRSASRQVSMQHRMTRVCGIPGQRGDAVGDIDVGLVAGGDEAAHAEAALGDVLHE